MAPPWPRVQACAPDVSVDPDQFYVGGHYETDELIEPIRNLRGFSDELYDRACRAAG